MNFIFKYLLRSLTGDAIRFYADNVTADAGSGGETFATDDIGGVHYPISKLTFGALDSQTIASSGNGATDAGTQRVTISSDSTGVLSVDDNDGSLTVDGAVTATLDAETTKVIGTINVAAAQTIAVTNGGTFATQATLQAGTAEFGKLAAGVAEIGKVKNSGTFAVQSTLQAGTAEIGKLAAGTAAIGKLAANSGVVIGDVNLGATDNAVLDDIAAKLAPNTTNGHSFYLNQDTNAVASVKASAGTIYWIACMSTDATPVYLNLYNVASGSVTLGTTTPDMQFIVPSQGDANGAGFTINFGPLGIQFGTAITVAAATTYDGLADPGANVVITNIGYE